MCFIAQCFSILFSAEKKKQTKLLKILRVRKKERGRDKARRNIYCILSEKLLKRILVVIYRMIYNQITDIKCCYEHLWCHFALFYCEIFLYFNDFLFGLVMSWLSVKQYSMFLSILYGIWYSFCFWKKKKLFVGEVIICNNKVQYKCWNNVSME